MSVKPTRTSSPAPLLRPSEATPSHPLEKVGQALQHAAKSVNTHVNRVVDTFEARLPTGVKPAGAKGWEGITLTGKPLRIPLEALKKVHLVDGGALDNLPMGYNKNGLPAIGASLYTRATGHPADHHNTTKPLPAGNLDSTNVLWNALNGYTLMKDSASDYNDYMDRTKPQANQFMLTLPTWDLTDPSKGDSTLKFGYDNKVDPALDGQSRQVTRNFLRDFLDDLRVPGSRGTNYKAEVPKDLRFDVPVEVKGKQYQVSYAGGDTLVATPAGGGKRIELAVGKQRIEAMYLDNVAFGDLQNQLAYTLTNPRSVKPSWLPF
ncbi:MAG TPA: hypothetical protein VE057_03835 [Archangium sp.]|nr:hypothetical protein [Archangium sp.]